jgi:hypothetical protein
MGAATSESLGSSVMCEDVNAKECDRNAPSHGSVITWDDHGRCGILDFMLGHGPSNDALQRDIHGRRVRDHQEGA